jgi:hypothetical protein
MRKAPEGALHNTKCPHSEAKKPLNRENTCPRWDSNQPLPPKVRHSPENLPDPAQSDTGTTQSEAQGVDTVRTLFWVDLMHHPRNAVATRTRKILSAASPSFRAMPRSSTVLPAAERAASTEPRNTGKVAG